MDEFVAGARPKQFPTLRVSRVVWLGIAGARAVCWFVLLLTLLAVTIRE